jgi:hypothetical protein
VIQVLLKYSFFLGYLDFWELLAFREAQQVGVTYRTAHTPADSFGSLAGCFYVFSYVPHSQ